MKRPGANRATSASFSPGGDDVGKSFFSGAMGKAPTWEIDNDNVKRYHWVVIQSFRDKDTERLFNRQPVRKLGSNVQRTALRKLRQLDAAVSLEDLRVPPGNRLERLHGDRSGQHSIRVNDQWRICFQWIGGDAHDVEIVDYH